jgi:hypothetical protein
MKCLKLTKNTYFLDFFIFFFKIYRIEGGLKIELQQK